MKGYALKKWESTLNFVFMPMDPMWNLSWKLLAKYLIIWVILSVSLYWIPCSYGSNHIVLLWSHSSGKFNYLSFADQYPSSTFTLIYRRVLHSGISRISWDCITSYEFFINCYFSTIPIFLVSRLSSTENTEYWIESALRFDNSKKFHYLWV